MAEPVDRTFFVQSNRRRINYQQVTCCPSGPGMAYDVTETLSDHQHPGDEVVADLVELDNFREELGLIKLGVGQRLVAALWRAVGADTKVLNPRPAKRREYRLGHKHRD